VVPAPHVVRGRRRTTCSGRRATRSTSTRASPSTAATPCIARRSEATTKAWATAPRTGTAQLAAAQPAGRVRVRDGPGADAGHGRGGERGVVARLMGLDAVPVPVRDGGGSRPRHASAASGSSRG
jgi:hypothetical protein